MFHRLTFNRAPARSTEETYKKVFAENDAPVDVEALDGYSICWIGPRTAKAVILFMHGILPSKAPHISLSNSQVGGGCTDPAFDAHVQFMLNGWKVMKGNNQDVAIAFLAYGERESILSSRISG